MPELPEIEIVKRSLSKMSAKAKILNIKINNKNLRYKITKTFSKSLIGEKILKISRRSKYIIIHFKKKILLIHLGMTGKLLFTKDKSNKIFKTSFYYNEKVPPKHNHIYFTLNNNLILIYNDIRRFGFFKIYKNIKLKEIPFLKKLGIEPFNRQFNLKYFYKYIKNKKKKYKKFINGPKIC